MDLKTVFIVLAVGFGCAFVVQHAGTFFEKDEAYCTEYYKTISEPEYEVTYGERIQATHKGCL